MLVKTGLQYNHRRTYRLIGSDLYSAPTNKPIDAQEYEIEKPNVIKASQAKLNWRIIVSEGKVYLGT